MVFLVSNYITKKICIESDILRISLILWLIVILGSVFNIFNIEKFLFFKY